MYNEIITENRNFKDYFADVLAKIGNFILQSIEIIVSALTISLVIWFVIASPHEVVGSSMYPTFISGDKVIANKLLYKIKPVQRGDVIIFKHTASEDYIKRIIGLPGDEIYISRGSVYLNGVLLDESSYLEPNIYTNGESYLHEQDKIVIPDGYYFVMGDNRSHSSDSRDFGPISASSIKGKVWLVWFPFSRLHIVEHAVYN
jgi:signal peptidase I